MPEKCVPAIPFPTGVDRNVERILAPIKETLDIWAGRQGDELCQLITLEDLLNSDVTIQIATGVSGSFVAKAGDTMTGDLQVNANIGLTGNLQFDSGQTVDTITTTISASSLDTELPTANAVWDLNVFQEDANRNIFGGTDAGNSLSVNNEDNFFAGVEAGYNNALGVQNVFIGNYSGRSAVASELNANVFIGFYSGYNVDAADQNVFIGDSSGQYFTSGQGNVHIGYLAGRGRVAGSAYSNNVFIGQESGGGANLNTAADCVMIGYRTGYSLTTGRFNFGVGHSCGLAITSGQYNFGIGYNAGSNITTGNRNISIGCNVNPLNATGDDQFVIGNQGYTYLMGDMANYQLAIYGADGYLNFNTTLGSSGYGFRDNSGVMEWKDSGGAWMGIAELTVENGFENRTDSSISFVDGTRTFTIQPTGGSFSFWSNGTKYTKSSAQNVVIPDTEGIHYIYFDASGNLTSTTTYTDDLITTFGYVAFIYWDATNNLEIRLGDERHGRIMDGATHNHFHKSFGTTFVSGLSLADFTEDASGDVDSHAQFSVANGEIGDEDLDHDITDGSPQDISPILNAPIFYRSGASGDWRMVAASAFPVYNTGSPNGRLWWNEWTGATWQLTEAGNNDFVNCHIIATNDPDEPIIAIIGQAEYNTVGQARNGAETELTNLNLGTFTSIGPEWKAIATVIYQTSNGYANTVQGRVRSADPGTSIYVDWRRSVAGSGGTGAGDFAPSNHTHTESDIVDLQDYVLVAGDTMTGKLTVEVNSGSYGPSDVAFLAGDSTGGDSTYIIGNTINAGFGFDSGVGLWINYRGYNAGNTRVRDLIIGNGQGVQIARFTGGTAVFQLYNGVAINEFSSDGTMAGNSDLAVPTEQAVVEYIDSDLWKAYGEIYCHDASATMSVSSAGWTQVTNFDTNGLSANTTPDHTNDHITIDTGYGGDYFVTVSIAAENSAGVGHIIECSVFKNNGATELLNVHAHRTLGTGSDKGSISLSGIATFAAGDTIELWITSDSGTGRNITVSDCTLSIHRIGGI